MINKVVLVGRLSKDPELRKTANNTSVANFTIAVDNRQKSADGKKTTSFIPCVCWNAVADNLVKYTKKGSLIGVEGRITQRTYKRTDGGTAQVVEILAETVSFLGPKQADTGFQPVEEVEEIDVSEDITEDDLPF